MEPTEFLRKGIAVIPVLFASKKPLVTWRRYQHTLPTESQVRLWFHPGRKVNAAVICGWEGLTVLDFDTHPDYVAWLAWAVAEGGEARRAAVETYRVRTSRGMHLYLFIDETPRTGHFQWGDIKGAGGYVLIPPSVHPSGTIYQCVDPTASILRVQSLGQVIPDPPDPPAPNPPPVTRVYAASSLWPKTIVDEIKDRMSILDLLPGAKPSGGQRWYMVRCPLHDDKEPSMRVDLEKGLCYCFTGCTPKPLDVIALYGRLHGLDNKQAVKELAKQL